MVKKLIIGLGPGRSGTMSLTKFLDNQKNSYFVHEGAYNMPSIFKYTTGAYLPWETDIVEYKVWYLGLMSKSKDSLYFGDIGASILQYVPLILNDHPDAKFICLRRNKDDVVKSFLTVTKGVNHWSIHGSATFSLNIWQTMFPKIKALSKKEAVQIYVDEYYKQAEHLSQIYPTSFRIFNLNDLNTVDGRSAIVAFAGIPRHDWKIEGEFHSNRSTYSVLHLFLHVLLMGYMIIKNMLKYMKVRRSKMC